jgi:hypothetical protein
MERVRKASGDGPGKMTGSAAPVADTEGKKREQESARASKDARVADEGAIWEEGKGKRARGRCRVQAEVRQWIGEKIK